VSLLAEDERISDFLSADKVRQVMAHGADYGDAAHRCRAMVSEIRAHLG